MTYIIPTIHPANLIRNPKPISNEIKSDLAKALRISMEGFTQDEHFVLVDPSNPSGLHVAVREGVAWLKRWQSLRCPVAVDIETSALNYFSCKLYTTALSGEDGYNTAVAFSYADKQSLPWDAELAMTNAMRDLLTDVNVPKVFHNAPFDCAVLEKRGYAIRGRIEDTIAYAHIIQPDSYKDLGWIGHTYLDVESWKIGETGKKKIFEESLAELLIYNAKDAINTMKLRSKLIDEIKNRQMGQRLMDYQNAFAQLATRMELTGLPINFEKRKAMGDKLLQEIKELKYRMRMYLKWPDFNPMNKNHAVIALYNEEYLGLTPTKFTEKTKQPSTKYEDLLDDMEHPFVKMLIAYVENHHVHAAQYRDDPPGSYRRAIESDGRLHPKWSPTSQKGSRFSSQPNCFSPNVELYTPDGWIPFNKLKPNPTVYQFNRDSNKFESTTAELVIQYGPHEMIGVRHNKISTIDMTLDHRIALFNPRGNYVHWMQAEGLDQRIHCIHANQRSWGSFSHETIRTSNHQILPLNEFTTTKRELRDGPVYCVQVPSGLIAVRAKNAETGIVIHNCQNQRVRDRDFFEAPEGRVFIGSDKSQLELRLAAVFAGVRELLDEMAKPDGDPHRLAAVNIFGKEFLDRSEREQKQLRNGVKTTVYASLYRGGIETVHKSIRKKKWLDPALRATLTLDFVSHVYHSFFGKYVEIPIWHDRNYALAQTQGYIEIPPLGRRRYFPVQPPPYTEVASWPVTTPGSDDVGMCMVHIQDELDRKFHGDASVIFHGHDQVVVECAERYAEQVQKIVDYHFGTTVMEGPAGSCQLTADSKIGKTLKDVK